MKEFAMKHPILTFFLADALITGIVNIVCSFSGGKKEDEEEPKEAEAE